MLVLLVRPERPRALAPCLRSPGQTCKTVPTPRSLTHLCSAVTRKEKSLGRSAQRGTKGGRSALSNGRDSPCLRSKAQPVRPRGRAGGYVPADRICRVHVDVCTCYCCENQSLPGVLMNVIALNTQKCLRYFSSPRPEVPARPGTSIPLQQSQRRSRGPRLFLRLAGTLELTASSPASLHTVQSC